MKKLLLIPFLLSLFSVAQAAEPIKVTFNDLQAKVEPYVNPFKSLTEDQLYNLSVYAQISEMQKFVPDRVTESMQIDAQVAKEELIADKIDIEDMLTKGKAISEMHRKAAISPNTLLADKTIEIGGYMLALEFDNGLVTEFLLVPTIGACSHKPVPPANQILLVNSAKPVKAGEAYEAVRVTGILRLSEQQKSLYLVDGKKSIDMAYTINDAMVVPYN